SDLWEHSSYFFVAPDSYDLRTIKKHWKEDTSGKLSEIAGLLSGLEKWEAEAVKQQFSDFINARQWSFGSVMSPLRLCLVGENKGPDIFRICELLGKEETIRRIRKGIETIILT
ncbi:MAG: glutamate--tRNA ligase, partial [Prolixibacteraceae bacterium]|nr:glutamate--tRNA ligase [Prolixibacteraceae bacterium]